MTHNRLQTKHLQHQIAVSQQSRNCQYEAGRRADLFQQHGVDLRRYVVALRQIRDVLFLHEHIGTIARSQRHPGDQQHAARHDEQNAQVDGALRGKKSAQPLLQPLGIGWTAGVGGQAAAADRHNRNERRNHRAPATNQLASVETNSVG